MGITENQELSLDDLDVISGGTGAQSYKRTCIYCGSSDLTITKRRTDSKVHCNTCGKDADGAKITYLRK